MLIVWITDVHLDALKEAAVDGLRNDPQQLSEARVEKFCQKVMKLQPDGIIITGDISTADNIELHLMWLEKYLVGIPIYFVLGNHDYYNGSIKGVRDAMMRYNGINTRCQWLNTAGVVELNEEIALVGHDGWYDGGYADWFQSRLQMTDYELIAEMKCTLPEQRYDLIKKLARECAEHIDEHVQKAARQGFKHVLFATHVPPFRENSRAPDRSLSDSHWLPCMSSKMAGDALLRAAAAFPEVHFTCLSGHTHTEWVQKYGQGNIVCITGEASYGKPEQAISLLRLEPGPRIARFVFFG